MGGFTTIAKDALAEKFASPALHEDAMNVINKGFSSFENYLKKSPAGSMILDIYKNDYEPTLKKAEQSLAQQAMAAAKSAPLPKGAQGPVAPAPGEIKNKAVNIAKHTAYGPNHALLAHAYQWAAHTNGKEYAQTMLDYMHVQFQDSVQSAHDVNFRGKNKPPILKGKVNVSAMKQDVLRNKGLNPELREGLDVTAKYQPRTPLERSLSGFAAMMQTPLIFINHLSTVGNTVLTEPLASLNKGIASLVEPGGYVKTKKFLLDSGVLADEVTSAYRDLYYYRRGILGKLGAPNLGYMIGKAIHHPFFHAERDITLTFAGAVGKISSERYARLYAANPKNKVAELRLKQIGLDPAQVLAQKGQLTQEQLEKAVYHAVDNKIFLSTTTNRSYYSQLNPVFRMASMYHNYAKRQTAFLINEGKLALKSGDPMQIAKTAAALAVGFPALGMFTEMLEDYGHGKDGYDNTKERIENIRGKHGLAQSVEQYLDFYSHVGGLGVMSSYVRAAGRHMLAQAFLGPIFGQGVTLAQDGFDAATGKSHKQLAKDSIRLTVPVVGSAVANKLYPSKKKKSGLVKLKGLKGLKSIH